METKFPFNQSLNTAKILIDQGRDNAFIEAQLVKEGIDAHILEEVMKQVKRIRNAQRTKTGSRLVLVGIILLGLGFISCIILHDAGASVDFALYGATAIGAVILVAGLAMIFS